MYLTPLTPKGRYKQSNNGDYGQTYEKSYDYWESYIRINGITRRITGSDYGVEGAPVFVQVHVHNFRLNGAFTLNKGYMQLNYGSTFLIRQGTGYYKIFSDSNDSDYWNSKHLDFSFQLHPDKMATSIYSSNDSFTLSVYYYDDNKDHSNADWHRIEAWRLPLKLVKNWRIPKLDVHTPISGIKNTPFDFEFTATNRNNSETSGKSLTTEIILDNTNTIYSNTNTVSGQKITQLIDTTLLTPGNHTLKVRSYHPGFPEETAQYSFQKTNTAPLISLTDTQMDLGQITSGFSKSYTVSDADNNTVTINEKLDTTVLRNFQAVPNQQETIELTRDKWLRLVNGNHKLVIEADDNNGGLSTAEYSFTKQENKVVVNLKVKADCDERPTKVLVTPTWEKEGSIVKVEACNNMNDEAPTWEDITDRVLINKPSYLSNETKTAEKWKIGIKITMKKNEGYNQEVSLSSIGGAYE